MKRLWTGKTARQEVVAYAALCFRLHLQHGWSVSDAVEHCIDGWEGLARRTVRHEMGRYVAGLSDTAYERLCSAITRAAK